MVLGVEAIGVEIVFLVSGPFSRIQDGRISMRSHVIGSASLQLGRRSASWEPSK